MRNITCLFSLFIVLGGLAGQMTSAQDFSGVAALTQRVAPWTKDKIVFHSLPAAVHDRFELETVEESAAYIRNHSLCCGNGIQLLPQQLLPSDDVSWCG